MKDKKTDNTMEGSDPSLNNKGVLKDTCCLCGADIQGHGNNASPVKEGVCCDECNLFKVVPARLTQTLEREEYKRRKR